MQNRKQFGLLVCMALILLASQTLWGQFVIQVNGTDGSGITDTLTLAVNPAGTAGFDSLSPTLREYEIPVAAKGLDFRVASNFPADVIGLGSYTSIHHMAFPTQTDKWKMQFNVDSGRTNFMIQWPAGLASVGGGIWKLIPDPDDVITFTDVDMTAGTSLSIPVSDIEPHTFFIVTGDKQKYRSFTANEIATASDSKAKAGKSEKRKPITSEGTFILTNNTTPPGAKTDLHIEWSQTLTSVSVTPESLHAFSDGPKNTKLDITFSSDSLYDGQTVTIFAQGNKGKQLQIKKYWWTYQGVVRPAKTTFKTVLPQGGGVLRLPMPNINNIGEEMYTQGVFPPGPLPAPTGLTIGDPANRSGVNGKVKDVFKAVVHPKWKDVLKTLVDKTGQQSAGTARCLDFFAPDYVKPIEKAQKSLPPGKHSNKLLGEAVALKVNIGAGDAGKIEEGGTVFGDLRYVRQVGDPMIPAGTSLRAIAESLDNFMRCHPSTWDSAYCLSCPTTQAQKDAWWNAVSRINASFSGPFDTLSFGQTQAGKPAGGTIATGTKAIMDVPILYRTSFSRNVPNINPPNIQALEARNQPAQYRLMQNYPNPFNPTTTIEFALPADGLVTLKVYNMLGQEVATLIDNQLMDEGTNEVSFDATSLASGVYFYRLIAQGVANEDGLVGPTVTKVMKMMLVK
jgi:hypothetical protein